jgi:parallel beta-helix repeat protein
MIINNRETGLYAESSFDNHIYHNNFLNNFHSAYDIGTNFWDDGYPSGGNYWSDFDEPSEGAWDNNTDGIVDTPHTIPDQNNQDNYPYIHPFDNIPPNISDIQATPRIHVPEGSINVTCRVIDNIEVDRVKINITGPLGFTPLNISMIKSADDDRYYFDSFYTIIGSYDYYIWAIDGNGNTVRSETNQFEIVSLDYILITERPGGNQIPDMVVGTEFYVNGYASAYNETYGYIGPISVTWSIETTDSDATTTPSTGTVSTLYTGTINSTQVILKADDGNGHIDTVFFTIQNNPIFVDDDNTNPDWYDDTHVHTIQEAINRVMIYQTIFVYNGTYHGNLSISKTMRLNGENAEMTIVDGGGNESVFSLTADRVTIQGFTIENSNGGGYGYTYGGLVVNSKYNTIIDNIITMNMNGVSLKDASYNTVTGNLVTGNSMGGIFVIDSSHNNISNNIIIDNFNQGVYVDDSKDNVIYGNNITNSRDPYETYCVGLSLWSSSHNIIQKNIFNKLITAIDLCDSSNNTFVENSLTNNMMFGMFIWYMNYPQDARNNLIYHNNFINNSMGNVCDQSTNQWDNGYPDGGNYWDDFEEIVGPTYDGYHGENQNISGSDGIIDLGGENGGLNPYPAGWNVYDRYPYMYENGWDPS